MHPPSPAPISCPPDHDSLEGRWISVVRQFLKDIRDGEKRSGIGEAMAVAEIIASAYDETG